jgi:hypothetical protein
MTDRLLNYTTKVPAVRTIGECQQLLANAGASAVAVMYEDRKPIGLSFRLATAAGMRDFTMPVNVAGVRKVLQRIDQDKAWPATLRPNMIAKYLAPEHAANVAWRVVKDWLEAQVAIIAAEMTTLDEVMLPYLQLSGGQTLYQAYLESDGLRVLESGHG